MTNKKTETIPRYGSRNIQRKIMITAVHFILYYVFIYL